MQSTVSRLEFIPVSYEFLADDLKQGRCDVVMSAVSVTPDRLAEMDYSKPYMELHPALVVPYWRRKEFMSLKDVQSRWDLKVAVIRGSEDIKAAKMLFPEASLIEINSSYEFFKGDVGDALFCTAEEGSVLAILHPYCSAVRIKSENDIIDAYAYPIARSNDQMLIQMPHEPGLI